MNFDTLLNNNKPQDKRFRDTRFFLGHINRVPRGLTVANIFSEYYKNSAFDRVKQIDKNKNYSEYINQNETQTDTFQLKKVTKNDTYRYIRSMKPKISSGADQIPSKIITMAASTLVAPITNLINKCFEEGAFPRELKKSKIVPIFKNKGEKSPGNFRPINQIGVLSKCIEKGAIEQLNNHFKQFENKNQFGYKEAHSTFHAILLTRHYIEQELNKGHFVLLIMIDLSIAFETINTGEILPAKLKHYGTDKKSVNFFNEYFQNRTHYVEWDNTESDTAELHNLSCVQGSALGPHIFNVYTNDLKDVCEGIIVSFADDTNIILSSKDKDKLMQKGNTETEKVNNYMSANELIINKEKSSYMVLTPKKQKKFETTKTLKIGTTEIKRVTEARYLGIIIDDRMTFRPQYDKLVKKLKEAINSLICTRNILNFKAKMMLYNALFRSHLEYAAITYYDKLKGNQIEVLKKLQKKAVRLVYRAPINCHTKKLFYYSEIIPVDKLYHFEAVKLMFKNKNELYKNKQPKTINEILTKECITRETRQSNDYYKIKINNEYKKGQAIYNITQEWNNADLELKQSGNIKILKRSIKEYNKNYKQCIKKDCVICLKDNHRDYLKYMNN